MVADALSRRPDFELTCLTSVSNKGFQEQVRQAQTKDPHCQEIQRMLEENSTDWRVREYSREDGLLRYDGRLFIPDSDDLRTNVMRALHEQAGHFGANKTYAAATRLVYWPRMDGDILKWTSRCGPCMRLKSRRGKQDGSSQPLQLPQRPWESISRDFITGLPLTRYGHDAVTVDVCRLTKMAVFTPSRKDDSAQTTARRFFDNVYRRFGLPASIISDRDPKFTGHFWRALFSKCGTSLNMSTADHPQSDGQTEITNRILEELLRQVTNLQQTDWDTHLPLCEFAYNSSVSSSTGLTPFEALYGFQPHTPLSLSLPAHTSQRGNHVPAAVHFCQDTASRYKLIRDRLYAAQQRQAKLTNRKKQEQTYKPGDRVLLHSGTLPLAGDLTNSRKLRPRFVGPFQILERIGHVAYRLRLPKTSTAHPVFHISKLRPYPNDVRESSRPAPYLLDGDQPFEVEELRDRRYGRRNRREYLVKWAGLGDEESTWEPVAYLKRFCADMVDAYDKQTPPQPSKKQSENHSEERYAIVTRHRARRTPPRTSRRCRPRCEPTSRIAGGQ